MDAETERATACLLEPDEPPAFELVNAAGRGTAVLLCDHAAKRVPRRLGTLGLEPRQLADHIAWDPGAAEVARRLSVYLDAPLLLSSYSRLVIDCNRAPEHEDSIAEQSAGMSVPGNRGITIEERETRRKTLFAPYHAAIEQLLDGRSQRATIILSIHSFTPDLNGEHRPWHLGVSHWRDRRCATRMIKALAQSNDIVVGDNEPYPIDAKIDYTIPTHSRGWPSIMIEIRQDGIRTDEGWTAWATRLANAYWLMETDAVGTSV